MSPAIQRPRDRAHLIPPPPHLPRSARVGAVIAVVAAAAYLFGINALHGYRLNREAARLAALKRTLQEHNAVLREEIRLLQTPGYIEKIAREQLGLVRPGEIAILIVPSPASPPPPPARPEEPTRPLVERLWNALTRWVQARGTD
ncbi:MAG: septum formation initiator family protein [Armatimonadota bacterium]|nr:septum formation initiator family protein [Armatimonadota bacterium]MDR7451676.1 septum formation initiator family protein [Armatimonadota bacterium]MDR7465706.1 septum formation initiator family protein [Armatimonadota bacterium]MDR7493615.1 septum formation initiator family protein [Armatimonadota bacterium]MDR7499481.1 septum formation initiator family protein [Armatimonadota bacterium]